MAKKKIAVIGGSFCGMLSIVALKAEGLEPVCFEASDKFDGLWNYKEMSLDEIGYLTPAKNSYKTEMGKLNNFPPEYETFIYDVFFGHIRNRDILQCMTEYYNPHECEKHIRFNNEVMDVRKVENYEDTGCFMVTVNDKISDEVSTDTFDGVVVATGPTIYPISKNFPGLDIFEGDSFYSYGRIEEVLEEEFFLGKKVLVIGTCCSDLDAANDFCSVVKEVYFSDKTGSSIFNGVGPKRYQMNCTLLKQYITEILNSLLTTFFSWYVYPDTLLNYNLFYFKSKKYLELSNDPILNGDTYSEIPSGHIIQKGDIKHFTENGVLFEGDTSPTEIDSVVLTKGCTLEFPFLDDGLLQINDGGIDLYKCMYPAHLPHSSLVFVGLSNISEQSFPLGDIQCRWAAHVFAGKGKLPSKDIMLKDCRDRQKENEKRYAPSDFRSVRVDSVSYQDDIASQMGCKPNLWKYFHTDFQLFLRLAFGPYLPYQYRLQGPHKWEWARKAIMACEERVFCPL